MNYLSHYVLTKLLVPLLARCAPARIVNVSSAGQQPIDFDDPMITRGDSGSRACCQSKLAQITWTMHEAPALAKQGITMTALHPATYMPTRIVPSPTSTIAEGVEATVRLVVDPKLEGVTGRYFDGLREARPDAQAANEAAQKQLMALSEKRVGSRGAAVRFDRRSTRAPSRTRDAHGSARRWDLAPTAGQKPHCDRVRVERTCAHAGRTEPLLRGGTQDTIGSPVTARWFRPAQSGSIWPRACRTAGPDTRRLRATEDALRR